MKDPKKVAQGKKNKASGAKFELRVRKHFEDQGWIVDKWSNNVEFDKCTCTKEIKGVFAQCPQHSITDLDNLNKLKGTLKPAKRAYNPFKKAYAIGTGFPDFIAFRLLAGTDLYEVIGVECKVGKYLDKEEKAKCQWYLNNNVFSKILIAYKTKVKNRIVINFWEFKNA